MLITRTSYKWHVNPVLSDTRLSQHRLSLYLLPFSGSLLRPSSIRSFTHDAVIRSLHFTYFPFAYFCHYQFGYHNVHGCYLQEVFQ